MYRRLLLSIVLILSLSAFALGQNILPIGQWRSHLPYKIGQYVTQSEQEIFYSTGLSVVAFDKEELSPRFLTKTDVLSQAGIQYLKYIGPQETLIVVYTNGTMDLVKPDEVITMPQITNFPNVLIGKEVNEIFIENDSTILLAASYGVSRVKITDDINEFSFTAFTGVQVNSVVSFEGFIYAATDEGIYRINADNFFPEVFTNWEYLDESDGFPMDYSAHAMAIFNGQFYFDINSVLYRWNESAPVEIHTEENQKMEYLSAEGAHLMAGYRCDWDNCGGNGKVLYFNPDESFGVLAPGCVAVPYNGIEDEQGRIWFGEDYRNFRWIDNVDDANCNTFSLNSPWSERCWNIEIENNQLWVTSGGLTPETLKGQFFRDGFYSFIDGQWAIYNDQTNDVMKGEDPDSKDDDLFGMISLAIDPESGKVYTGSYFEGLIEVDGENVRLYNENNSTLQAAEGDDNRVRVLGLAVDEESNLWVTNALASGGRPLSVLRPDGTWKSFDEVCGFEVLMDVVVDANGYKWIRLGDDGAGLLLFDEGDLDDDTDDRCQFFSSGNSNLQTNDVTSLAVDLDGDVWVGTTAGIVIFECGGNAFDDECNGSRRIVVGEDGNPAYLFETERIEAIAVDGANRKWVGTSTGAYLLSANGEDELLYFNQDNSPLLDNTIYDIACNQQTGEVFFATNKGIVSYQGDAVEGGFTHKENFKVFPNPVRPDYDGPITIRGFSRDATVKITDISGKLVFETQALGGQAIWDGRDYNGRRANTGVYLVFATTSSSLGFTDPDSAVAKVVLIN